MKKIAKNVKELKVQTSLKAGREASSGGHRQRRGGEGGR
jgi:hypothetical protein